MSIRGEHVIMVIGAVVVTLLQIMVAPYITIWYATPNFMAAYALAIAVIRPNSSRVAILAFAMGILYNLFLGGAMGSLAVALILCCIVAGRVMSVVDNGTSFMPVAIMAIALFVAELIYGFLTSVTLGLNLGDVMMLRVAPCFVYDLVLALVLYFIMSRLAAEPDQTVSIGGPTLLR